MGLCKCPKKKVTNLFCFEHRVNVCEYCLVTDHVTCIVQSYLQWLQDSDYSSDCKLCSQPLVNGECIRLLCYDVYHWNCLSNSVSQLPINTAPAGYECPSCSSPIIPQSNTAGPVAECLRVKLQEAPWARAGLGLPLQHSLPLGSDQGPLSSTPVHGNQAPPLAINEVRQNKTQMPQPFLLDMNEPTIAPQSARKQFDHDSHANAHLQPTPPSNRPFDSDEDKYRRRPAMDWLAQWFKSSLLGSGRRGISTPKSRFRRMSIMILLGVIAFLTVMLILSTIGRNSADRDPMLDPAFNPNIRVQENIPVVDNMEPVKHIGADSGGHGQVMDSNGV